MPSRFNFTPEQRQEMTYWLEDFRPSWKVYFTGTFRYSSSLDSATRCYEKFMKFNLPSVGYFFVCELNGHGWHIHALWSATDCVYRKEIWRRWFDRYGINRILPIRLGADSYFNVSSYCAKYLTKELSWWNLKEAAPSLGLTQSRGRV